MSVLAAVSTALLGAMLVVAVWNLVAAPRLEPRTAARTLPRISLLIPARNEADVLPETLAAVLRLDYPSLEVLVLDDQSTDGTAAFVEALQAQGAGRLRLLRGEPVPDGWLGKNWACHQLARAASGDILVFCDADVTPHPGALRATVSAMEAHDADAVTAIPRQRPGPWLPDAVVPLVTQFPILALLPLWLVPRVSTPSVAMGNGQWLAFTREAYADSGGHAAVRREVVEDVALARRVKRAGHRLLVVVATRLLEARTYADASSLRDGFGKNLYALTGAHPAGFAAALALFASAAIYPWAAALLGARDALVPLALLLGVRLCGIGLFRNGIATIGLHPVASVVLVGLGLESFARSLRGTVRWKGRRLAPQPVTARERE